MNKRSRLKWYKRALPGKFVWAGDNKVPVLRYRDIIIKMKIPKKGIKNKDKSITVNI